MKTILGLDLGTNSVGWALIQQDFENKRGKILGLGSRIIPMSQDIMGKFGDGNSISQTAERTDYRSVRRLRERFLLRRERLHRVLHVLGCLPAHYAAQIDFEKRLGKFKEETEPKLAYHQGTFQFMPSFHEMLADFSRHQPGMLVGKEEKTLIIPYDWTLFYLRKKALTQKIEKEELAWVIMNFNQKRGYNQLRGEEAEENPNKRVEFHSLKIVDVRADEPQKGKAEQWYALILENGWVYRRSSKTPLFDWKDKTRDFIVTTDINPDGSIKTDKEGNEKRSFRAPGADDWTLLKKKIEQEIGRSKKTVGTYIYDHLLENPKQKIKGELVRTIERDFYKDEIRQILEKQKEFHPELNDEDLFGDCIRELYRNNEAHQLLLEGKDFVHLFIHDIIFYQRPLRSQKSSIGNCSLEYRPMKDANGVLMIDAKGNEVVRAIKAIAKSNPYYQEFRLWQWISNLSIQMKDNDSNSPDEFLTTHQDQADLFEFLNVRKEIDQKTLIKFFLEKKGFKGKALSAETEKYSWNFVEDKLYPGNETRAVFLSRLNKVAGIAHDFLTREREQQLWHLIYSVTDREEYYKGLKTFAIKNGIDEDSFVEAFKKFPPFKSEYGSFSEKAIKKLLPLMRVERYWSWENIDEQVRCRIEKILAGEVDEEIKDRVREKAKHLQCEESFQGLPLWLAQYVVYNRHSEAAALNKWYTVADLEDYLKEFKQHSLRNPIVEQVVTETLRVVKDIWIQYGKGGKDFFNEIHVELGRDMKNPADKRKQMTAKIVENENTNHRIKLLLAEMMNDVQVENVRPYSPMQQEILKVYEEGVLNSAIEVSDEILKISKTASPSSADLRRYKLWLEQKYKSPYTGQIIPLNKLFTPEYEIEHIIPQSLYYDDSFSNKIICETAVNKLKDSQLAFNFIKNHQGQKVNPGMGKAPVSIFKLEDYVNFVHQHYAKNKSKRNKLLMEEIPDGMIERQINDTRYISKFVSALLSNIVRSATHDDGVNSKHVLPGNGRMTTELKRHWGLEHVWNELVMPRFERMNVLTNSSGFTTYHSHYQKYLPAIPLEFARGFSKKRIDHRHHAMDALVIACATRDHLNYLNNRNANSDGRFDLKRKLMRYERVSYLHPKTGQQIEREVPKDFLLPWDHFTTDAKAALEKTIVSFKQNIRVINKATNHYEKWVEKDGVKTKERQVQEGANWAVRKPLHKETVSGKVDLKWVKVPKGKILTATRKRVDASFDLKTIGAITDTGIQKVLKNYLMSKGGNPEIAFSAEGLEDLNKNIRQYNEGNDHQPIHKVRLFELGSKFPLGVKGNKGSKYVEAAKGTNLFFAVYADKAGKRSFESIPLNEVVERQKQGLEVVPQENGKGDRLLFYVSPNDLVYIPDEEQVGDIDKGLFAQPCKQVAERIYKVVSFTGNQVFFIRQNVATSIVNKAEFSSKNKMERALDGRMIKEYCIKLKVDRLGNISIHQ